MSTLLDAAIWVVVLPLRIFDELREKERLRQAGHYDD
jgi:hypothetical protein